MEIPEDDLNLDTIRCFLDEQVNNLQLDKVSLHNLENLKPGYSTSYHGHKKETRPPVCESVLPNTNGYQSEFCSMLKQKPVGNVLDNRELEKEKLIKLFSEADPYLSPRRTKKSLSPSTPSPRFSVIDPREQEKDRLAAIFASSSPSHLCSYKPSYDKRTNKRTCFESTKQFSHLLNKEYSVNSSLQKEIPEVSLSRYTEDSTSKDSPDIDKIGMVRIGEFSPLNPNNMGRRPSLGIGEYGEERHRVMLDRRKQEYNDSVQQDHQQTIGQAAWQDNPTTHRPAVRTTATQTEWNSNNLFSNGENPISLKIPTMPESSAKEPYRSPRPFAASPSPSKSIDDVCEKEVKEQIYRDELKKQIEEKNRLKQLMKKREEEEEAKIEAKIQRDLEKMRQQYEEERLLRMELAIKKNEQEVMLRQKLAEKKLKDFEECKARRDQLHCKARSLNDKACQKSTRCNQSSNDYLKNGLPYVSCTSRGLTDTQGRPRQPLLEVLYDRQEQLQLSPPERDLAINKEMSPKQIKGISSSTNSQQPVVGNDNRSFASKCPSGLSVSENDPLHFLYHDLAEKSKEMKGLPKSPVVSQLDEVLSPPLMDTSVPSPQHPPSPPLPACKRPNCEILEDKWKIPNTEEVNDKTCDVFSNHNRSVLTQLGEFRRHLQQERLRMQQRVRDDSP